MPTGLIKGRVQDDKSCYGIHFARVKNSTGGEMRSIYGEYRIVANAGESTVTATAAGYTDEIIHNVTVHEGSITTVNFNMHR